MTTTLNMTEAELEALVRESDIQALEDYQAGKADAPTVFKAYSLEAKAVPSEGPITVVASHESPDRMGDTIKVDGWQLSEFRKNPVLLWSHNPMIPPVGRVKTITPEKKELLATVEFDLEDPLGMQLDSKFRQGFMKGVSVGFRPIDFERNKDGEGFTFTSQELVELSAVSIPAHPKALAKALAMQHFSITVPDLSKIQPSNEPEPETSNQPPSGTQADPPNTTVSDFSNGTIPVDVQIQWKVDDPVSPSQKEKLRQAIRLLQAVDKDTPEPETPEPETNDELDGILNAITQFKGDLLGQPTEGE